MNQADDCGVAAYMALRLSHAMFEKAPPDLAPAELKRLGAAVRQQLLIETRIMTTAEAKKVVVPEATVDDAVDKLRSRYDGDDSFRAALEAQGFDLCALRHALARELRVEAVLDQVSANSAEVSELDVQLHYHLNRESYRQPERRKASHILITVNDDFADNTREAARGRLEAIRSRVVKKPSRFAEQALKHSECPTALNGGALGEYLRGQLFPELDACLFAMEAGELSEIVETDLGFHLLRCDEVSAGGIPPYSQIAPGIRAVIEAKRRRRCQRAWIADLLREPQAA